MPNLSKSADNGFENKDLDCQFCIDYMKLCVVALFALV